MGSEQSQECLPFTGERFTPECVREIWYEHWHRYAFVLPLARGRRVLDAACGEGYGSALLATVATSVCGVDLDNDTICHARARYGDRKNLSFVASSVTMIDLPDASVDLIVSFETIEHLVEQEAMLEEFMRLLAPGGLVVLSSPDRDVYNASGAPNPYHLRELNRDEFTGLIRKRFPAIHLYGQKLAFHSLLWRLDHQMPVQADVRHLDVENGRLREGPDQMPVYYLAVCARHEGDLPVLPGLSLFADEQASVYRHYNEEIARLVRADHRIIALERELAELRVQLQST